jgi:hypothetical protein
MHLLNAHHLNVADIPDFLAGVSRYLEVNIKTHQDSEDHWLTALKLLPVSRCRSEILFYTRIL